jgi:hypothetical protein
MTEPTVAEPLHPAGGPAGNGTQRVWNPPDRPPPDQPKLDRVPADHSPFRQAPTDRAPHNETPADRAPHNGIPPDGDSIPHGQLPAEPADPGQPVKDENHEDSRRQADRPERAWHDDRRGPDRGRPERGSIADLRLRLDRLPAGHPSSPYNDDGSRKPPVARLRDLELPLTSDDRPADAGGRRDRPAPTDAGGRRDRPALADATAAHGTQTAGSGGAAHAGPLADPGRHDSNGVADTTSAPYRNGITDPGRQHGNGLADPRRPDGSEPAEPASSAPYRKGLVSRGETADLAGGPGDDDHPADQYLDTRPTSSGIRPRGIDVRSDGSGLRPIDLDSQPGDLDTRPGDLDTRPGDLDSRPGDLDSRPGDLDSRPDLPERQPDRTAPHPGELDIQPDGPDGQPGSPDSDDPRSGADGSWNWSGWHLTPGQCRIADSVLGRCRAAEGRNMFGSYGETGLTPAMRRIEGALEHGRLVPETEQYVLKSPDRFKQKLARLITRFPGNDPAGLAAGIYDGVRYTFLFENPQYTAGIAQSSQGLKDAGYELVEARPGWDREEYKGISSRWLDPVDGFSFEVQWHTPESWSARQQTHAAAAKIADPATSLDEVEQLRAFQRAVSAQIPIPADALQIGPYRKQR